MGKHHYWINHGMFKIPFSPLIYDELSNIVREPNHI